MYSILFLISIDLIIPYKMGKTSPINIIFRLLSYFLIMLTGNYHFIRMHEHWTTSMIFLSYGQNFVQKIKTSYLIFFFKLK